ncbi:hypothetical protein ACVJEA_001833 [Vibrio cholerae]
MKFKKNIIFTSMLIISTSAYSNQWTEFYNVVEPEHFPNYYNDDLIYSSGNAYFAQKMYMTASDINNIFNGQSDIKRIVIITDVLELDRAIIDNITGKQVQIIARSIQGNGSFAMSVKDDGVTSFTIYSDNVSKESKIIIMDPSSAIPVNVDNGSFFRYYNINGNANIEQSDELDITGFIASLPERKTFIFDQAFDLASSVYDQNPELSISILDWYSRLLIKSKKLIEGNSDFSDLYNAIKMLYSFYESNNRSANYVPDLKHNVYSESYQTILSAMSAYQLEYNNFDDQKLDLEKRKESAILMLEHLKSALTAQQGIIDNQNSKIEQYTAIINERIESFKKQLAIVEEAERKFKEGLFEWEIQQGLGMFFNCVSILAELAGSIISAYTGNVGEVAQNAADMAEQVTGIFNAQNLKKIAETIKTLKELTDSFARILQYIRDGVFDYDLHAELDKLTFSIPDIEATSLTWSLASSDIDTNLGLAKDLKIRGAQAYHAQLGTLMIWGSSISSTQLSLVQMAARVADLELEKKVITEDIQRIEDMLHNIESTEDDLKLVEQYLFRVYNSFKRPLYAVQLNYNAAFRYYTFQDSTILPKVNGSYIDYSQDLMRMDTDLVNAIGSFAINPPLDFNNSFILDDEALLNELKSTGSFSFKIDESNHNTFAQCLFDGKERVRLKRMGVQLLGDNLPDGRYEFQISHPGGFTDFFNKSTYKFSSNGSNRFYTYFKKGTEITEEISGELSEDFGVYLFEPTLFTNWTIKLKNPNNIGDLSNVNAVKIKLSGSSITIPWRVENCSEY